MEWTDNTAVTAVEHQEDNIVVQVQEEHRQQGMHLEAEQMQQLQMDLVQRMVDQELEAAGMVEKYIAIMELEEDQDMYIQLKQLQIIQQDAC